MQRLKKLLFFLVSVFFLTAIFALFCILSVFVAHDEMRDESNKIFLDQMDRFNQGEKTQQHAPAEAAEKKEEDPTRTHIKEPRQPREPVPLSVPEP